MWLLLMLVTLVKGRPGQVCDNMKNKLMQENFTNCTMKYSHEYHETIGRISRTSDVQAATCNMFSQAIDKCGEIFKECHNEEEIRRMKDMHIIALIGQYGDTGSKDINVDHCDIVREYRMSGRQDNEKVNENDMCTDSETVKVQSTFQKCYHSISISVQEDLQDVTDASVVSDNICQALTKIVDVCVESLIKCFSPGDISSLRSLHLEEMKEYFVENMGYKADNESLNSCPVFEYIISPSLDYQSYNTSEYYDDYYEEDYSGSNDLDHTLRHLEEEDDEVTENNDNPEREPLSSQTVRPEKADSIVTSNGNTLDDEDDKHPTAKANMGTDKANQGVVTILNRQIIIVWLASVAILQMHHSL